MTDSLESMETEPYRIPIDGDWTLEDLYVFSISLGQVYAFLYSMALVNEIGRIPNEEDQLYLTYTSNPWRDGYSDLIFYSYLQSLVPHHHRPQIISIQFSSPGLLELGVLVLVASQIKNIVKSFCYAGREINLLVNEIHKGLQDRKLQNILVKREELKLAKEYIDFLTGSIQDLSAKTDFNYIEELYQITDKRFACLIIILSFY